MAAKTQRVLEILDQFESRNITFRDPSGEWPIVWERAQGVSVWDIEGRKYLDLTAGFGVAAAGHANPRVVRAGQSQMQRLLHAMGDVHPHKLKARLARELSRITFERWSSGSVAVSNSSQSKLWGKTIFCNSGFEAVEAALKTALLATGRPGVIAFEGAYHGLGYGVLNTTHRMHFRGPFHPQLARFGRFVPYPTKSTDLTAVERGIHAQLKRGTIGAVLVEPVQGRGGIRVPPLEFLAMLRQLCDEQQLLLIVDEIYTGFGRTGRWFACEHSTVIPDLVCLGKALTGGFPLSACVGKATLMDKAWPRSSGEAIHTSTFLGHPVGCAMALAQIQELENEGLIENSSQLGLVLLAHLNQLKPPPPFHFIARGLGLLAGLEVIEGNKPATEFVLRVVKSMLQRGFILLPEGEHGNVIAFSPPLTITQGQLNRALTVLENLPELSQSRTRRRPAVKRATAIRSRPAFRAACGDGSHSEGE